MSSEMFVFPLLRLFFFYILQLDNDVLSWGFCFGFVELPVYEDWCLSAILENAYLCSFIYLFIYLFIFMLF